MLSLVSLSVPLKFINEHRPLEKILVYYQWTKNAQNIQERYTIYIWPSWKREQKCSTIDNWNAIGFSVELSLHVLTKHINRGIKMNNAIRPRSETFTASLFHQSRGERHTKQYISYSLFLFSKYSLNKWPVLWYKSAAIEAFLFFCH